MLRNEHKTWLKKILWGGGILLLSSGVVFGASNAETTIATATSFITHIVVYVSWILIALIGDLLSNDFVMSPRFLPGIQLFWVTLRNLVNTAFILLMIVESYQVMYKGYEHMKESLKNIALALILVNFSFLAVRVVVDASTLATYGAFSLVNIAGNAETSLQNICKERGIESENCQVKSIQFNKNMTARGMTALSNTNGTVSPFVFFKKDKVEGEAALKLNKVTPSCTSQESCTAPAQYQCAKKNCSADDKLKELEKNAGMIITLANNNTLTTMSPHAIVPLIGNHLLKIENFVYRNPDAKNFFDLTFDVLFQLILSLMFLSAFAIMTLVMIIRIIAIWGAMIFSPLLAFYIYEIPFFSVKSVIEEQGKDLLKLIFSPALFGVAFSVIFMLMGQMSDPSLTKLSSGEDIILTSGALASDSTLFNLFLLILTIVLLWKISLWALSSSGKMGESASQYLEDKRKTWSGDIQNELWNTPIPVLKTKEGVKSVSMSQIGNQIKTKLLPNTKGSDKKTSSSGIKFIKDMSKLRKDDFNTQYVSDSSVTSDISTIKTHKGKFKKAKALANILKTKEGTSYTGLTPEKRKEALKSFKDLMITHTTDNTLKTALNTIDDTNINSAS
jgi:hypothetical protein